MLPSYMALYTNTFFPRMQLHFGTQLTLVIPCGSLSLRIPFAFTDLAYANFAVSMQNFHAHSKLELTK